MMCARAGLHRVDALEVARLDVDAEVEIGGAQLVEPRAQAVLATEGSQRPAVDGAAGTAADRAGRPSLQKVGIVVARDAALVGGHGEGIGLRPRSAAPGRDDRGASARPGLSSPCFATESTSTRPRSTLGLGAPTAEVALDRKARAAAQRVDERVGCLERGGARPVVAGA